MREGLFCQALMEGYFNVIDKIKNEFDMDVKRKYVCPVLRKTTLDYPFSMIVRKIDKLSPKEANLYEKNLIKTAKLVRPTDESLIPDDVKALALKYGL